MRRRRRWLGDGWGKGSSGGEAGRGSCCETTKFREAEAFVEGVSVLHEEQFNEFGETSWAKFTLNKARIWSSANTTFVVFFVFETVTASQGIAHGQLIKKKNRLWNAGLEYMDDGRVSELIGLYHKSCYYILVTRATRYTRANAWSG